MVSRLFLRILNFQNCIFISYYLELCYDLLTYSKHMTFVLDLCPQLNTKKKKKVQLKMGRTMGGL